MAATVLTGAPARSSAAATGTPTGLTWSRLSPPERPPALEDGAAAYDGADQTVVLFGGRLADGQLSDQTWVWNGSTWASPATGGASPPARAGASMAFDAHLDQLILFGGQGAGGDLLDDTWAWNGASWTPIATAETPGGREGAALAGDADGHLVLFGGYGTSNGSPPPSTTTTAKRSIRHRHRDRRPAPTTTTTPGRTTTTSTPAPPATTTTTTTPATTAPSSTTTTTPTTTAGSATTTTTAPVTAGPASTVAPSSSVTSTRSAGSAGRWAARLTAVSESASAARVLGDTWLLSRAADGSDQWTQAPTPTAPPPRTDAALSAAAGDQTILFGGTARGPSTDQRGALRGDTWIWDGRGWSKPKLVTSPSARTGSGFEDTVGQGGLGNAVLFGGLGASRTLGDTWLWDGRGWRRLSPASPASARSGAATAYDQADAQYVVFGGRSATGRLISDTQVLTTRAPQRVVTSPVEPGGSSPTSGGPGRPGGSARPGPSGSPGSSTGPGGSGRGSPSSSTSAGSPLGREATVHRGDVVTLTGSGFRPGTLVTITFHSAPQKIGEVHADANGAFLANVVVPGDAAPGAHHFEATGLGVDGRLLELLTPVEVAAVLGHRIAEWIKATLVAVAIAIPVVSWFAVGLLSRRRLAHQP